MPGGPTGSPVPPHARETPSGPAGEATREVVETQARLSELGTLAAGIAHELSNPLGFVKSNTEFIQQRLLQAAQRTGPEFASTLAEVQEVLSETLDGIRRMVAITAELRLVARSAGPPQPVDVERAIEGALLLTHNLLKYKAQVIREYVHPRPVLAEEGRLTQVFINLLANAAHAIEKSGVITVTTAEQDAHVVASVTDTGCGIPREAMNRLFEPFFTTKPPGVGTGLGLWLVRETVQAFGGRVEIASEVGRGTTVRVILPAAG